VNIFQLLSICLIVANVALLCTLGWWGVPAALAAIAAGAVVGRKVRNSMSSDL
jgi:hypothetical protein